MRARSPGPAPFPCPAGAGRSRRSLVGGARGAGTYPRGRREPRAAAPTSRYRRSFPGTREQGCPPPASPRPSPSSAHRKSLREAFFALESSAPGGLRAPVNWQERELGAPSLLSLFRPSPAPRGSLPLRA